MIHIDLCHSMPTLSQRYKLRVVPYEDDYDKIMEVYQSLGTKFDFLIGAFNSNPILSFASCKQLGTYNVCVALPRSHPLAKKEKLSITDLYNEKLLCVSSGDCLNLDDFRKDMQTFYPQIILEDVGYFYDLDTFNRCEEEGCLLLTLDAWDNIHPSLITLPVEWDYQMPYGLLYKKNPSKQVKDCLKELINMSNRTKLQLEDAFKELLLEKTFHKITIKDLTDKCHISRMAFYYHLNEKKDYAHWKEGLSNIFEAVYINKPFILNVYHDISRDKIEKILFKLVHELIESVVEERSKDIFILNQQKDFIAHFYKYGFVGVMLDWIDSGMDEDYQMILDDLEMTVLGTIDLSIQNFTNREK